MYEVHRFATVANQHIFIPCISRTVLLRRADPVPPCNSTSTVKAELLAGNIGPQQGSPASRFALAKIYLLCFLPLPNK